jgi:hypothetical protein
MRNASLMSADRSTESSTVLIARPSTEARGLTMLTVGDQRSRREGDCFKREPAGFVQSAVEPSQ